MAGLAGTHFDPELTRAFLEIAPGLAHDLALVTDEPRVAEPALVPA